MGKNTIRLISGIMLTALLCLLGVQWYWTQNAVALQESQFEDKVQSAMRSVAEALQDREIMLAMTTEHVAQDGHTKLIVQHDIRGPHTVHDVSETRVIIQQNSKDSTIIQKSAYAYSYETMPKATAFKHHNWVHKGDSLPAIHGAKGEEDHYAFALVKRILHNPLPISQRIDSLEVRHMLRQALAERGIPDAFEFSITTQGDEQEAEGPFSTVLFPHDIPSSKHSLQVNFPERSSLAMQTMTLLLPTSGVLALILVGCFAFTLIVIQRQKKLSQMKTDFINNMTHELKTPISTISLAVQALDDPDMRAAGKTDHYLSVIRAENARLQSQVERVLQAAAGERGEIQPHLQPTDLDAILLEEVERMRFVVEERQGRLDYQRPESPIWVNGDPSHLAGIVRNLLDNAVKYSRNAPEVLVRLEKAGGMASVEVSDKGIGLSREARNRIFDAFYRVHTGNLHDVKGFGLGLSYVKAMVEAHHGSVEVRSEPGKGSIFRFSIPLSQQPA